MLVIRMIFITWITIVYLIQLIDGYGVTYLFIRYQTKLLSVTRKHFFNISDPSISSDSEFPENLEEMFFLYYMHSDVFKTFQCASTQQDVIRL